MKQKRIKYFLLFALFLLLWAPMLQDALHIFKGGELKGAYNRVGNVDFDIKNWFNGNYPDQKNYYITNNFGFRPDLIRLYEQIQFSVFHRTSNEGLVVGKENYLYEQAYINSWYGDNYNGDDKIRYQVSLLKQLQDTLKQHGIFLYTVVAPGKGSFYSEYIPDYPGRKRNKTNYEGYSENFRLQGINYVDLLAYFKSIKDTSRYRLFPRAGIHWSYYGELLAFDTMMRYVERETKIDLPDYKLDNIELSTRPRSRDYDIGSTFNLISPMYGDTLAYPHYLFTDTCKKKINYLDVGDSFYFIIQGDMVPNMFNQGSYYFDYHDLYFSDSPMMVKDNVDLKSLILKQKVICILYNDGTLNYFGSGFVEDAVAAFKPKPAKVQ